MPYHESRIYELRKKIREFIQHPRRLDPLLRNKRLWFMLCSSMDALDDTEMAIDAYIEQPGSEDKGACYLLIYGILQSLFVQQDAISDLVDAFGLSSEKDRDLQEIREVRNRAIGHPTKRKGSRKKGIPASSHFIVQVSVTKTHFTIMSKYETGETNFEDIDVMALIQKQHAVVTRVLEEVWEALKVREREHREKFKGEKLIGIFPPTLGYMFEKLSLAAHGSDPHEAPLGAWGIQSIRKAICDFKAALEKRGILNESSHLSHCFEELDQPTRELELYLTGEHSRLDPDNAPIYVYFVRGKVDDLQEIAKEIDQEYTQGVDAET